MVSLALNITTRRIAHTLRLSAALYAKTMIHRQSRYELALKLRQFASGRITNDELESVSVDWRDRGAVAVQQAAWFLYHDTHKHRATGANSLGEVEKSEVARCVLFLHSDNEYIWPEYSFRPLKNTILNLLTIGRWNVRQKIKWAQYKEAGDFEVWPFINYQEFNYARQHANFLASNRA